MLRVGQIVGLVWWWCDRKVGTWCNTRKLLACCVSGLYDTGRTAGVVCRHRHRLDHARLSGGQRCAVPPVGAREGAARV